LQWPLAAVLLATPALAAQDTPLARGAAAMARWDLATARQELELAVRRDSAGYEANWRLAHVLMDIGKETPDSVRSAARDSLYARAERYARRAVAANPQGADGHFVLAAAIGRGSLTRSRREQVERASEIRTEALRALGLDPQHAGALHVLGRWHAEIQRLSGVEKFFARTFLGADIFGEASWDEAERLLGEAVRIAPTRIFHRLDFAEVLIDRKAWDRAGAQLDTLLALPAVEPMDRRYQGEAARLQREVIARRRR
jgi:tetratricopeptide (TPR) repeat protein